MHQCNLCKREIKENTCLKCINNLRVKCENCRKTLKQCESCKNYLVCSKKCYLENKYKKNGHLCKMFLCDECLKNNNIDINKINSGKVEIINRGAFIKNDDNSSDRRLSQNKINILNNHIPRNNINNISFTDDKKKTCCDCCIIY